MKPFCASKDDCGAFADADNAKDGLLSTTGLRGAVRPEFLLLHAIIFDSSALIWLSKAALPDAAGPPGAEEMLLPGSGEMLPVGAEMLPVGVWWLPEAGVVLPTQMLNLVAPGAVMLRGC